MQLPKILKQSAFFLTSSIIGFFINLAIIAIFTELLRIYYIISAIFAFIFSTLFSFLFNKRLTFKSRSKSKKEHLKFFIVSILALLFNLSFLYLLTEYLGIFYIISQIISAALAFFINFVFHRYWTFRN